MKIEKLYQDIQIKPKDVIVFGCSYGPDSMALFKSLLLLRNKIDVQLVCAHVNHGKRKESEQEKIDLENYCKKNNVVFEYMKIMRYGDDNFHNEARNIRYQFFKDVAFKYHARYIMTAHHADDLMETILMRIARGSTLEGYSGFRKMYSFDQYIIYRPFIEYTKQELLAFDEKYHVPFAIDASNEMDVYTRNRYRKIVLPFLKKEDPNIHQKFFKYSCALQEATDYLFKQTQNAMDLVVSSNTLNIDLFLQTDPYLQKRIIESMLSKFYQDDLILIGEKHIQAILKMTHSKRANLSIDLPNDVVVYKSYQQLTIQKKIDAISSYDIEITDCVMLPNHHKLQFVTSTEKTNNTMCRLSSHDVKLPLRVRTRENGDTIALKGGGHKKVKDIFIDKKIPSRQRDVWPIVVDADNRIVFIPGLKKSKFDRKKDEIYDIILEYE